MNLWQDLVSAAAVGTSRQFQEIDSVNGKLGNFLSRLDTGDPESALLAATVAYQLHQNAGKLPLKDKQSLPFACELDYQLECSPGAVDRLSWILRGYYRELLPEWLNLAAAKKQRVPDRYLPALLEIGRSQSHLISAILPILGKRGRWLAAQNPDWDYAVGDDDKTIWKTGSINARQLLLQRLRHENPASTRELVAANWAEETSESKAAILATFKTGLNMADEPFLESCLDDYNQKLRQVAADLLARLPESRLVRRAIARVTPLLTLTGDENSPIDVQLPECCDEEAIRDGIDPEMHDIWGDESWWMVQMLGFVPPDFWHKSWGISPVEIVPKIKELYEEWDLILMAGWATAAVRHRDEYLAEALLKAYPIVSEIYYDNDVFEEFKIQELMNILPPQRREFFIIEVLKSPEGLDYNRCEMVKLCQFPWSVEMSRAVLDSVRRTLATGTTNYLEEVREAELSRRESLFLEIAVAFMPLSQIQEVSNLLDEVKEQPEWSKIIDNLMSGLQFRDKILKEF